MAKHFKQRQERRGRNLLENTRIFCYDEETGEYEEIPLTGKCHIDLHYPYLRIDIPTMYFEGVTNIYIGEKNKLIRAEYGEY